MMKIMKVEIRFATFDNVPIVNNAVRRANNKAFFLDISLILKKILSMTYSKINE